MSKSFTPKVGAKETPTTHRKSTSKVSAKNAHPTHRKPTSQVAAEKASNAHRKETPKVATETVRGTHRKVAAKFQEFRARKVAAKFQEFRAPQKPHAMPAFAEGGLNEFRATAVLQCLRLPKAGLIIKSRSCTLKCQPPCVRSPK